MASRERLLREYVRRALREDFGGGDFGGDFGDLGGGMGYGFGAGWIDQSDMYKVFVKPFTDVFDTAVGKTKEASLATQQLLKVAFEAAATSIIPFLSSDYDKIFSKYEKEIEDVRSEYRDIYDSTWTAFTDNDVVLAAFAMAPHLFLTQLSARKAPVPVIKTVDALTGGVFQKYLDNIIRILNPDEVKPLDDKGGRGGGDVWAMGGYGMGGYGFDGGFDGGGFGEGVIREKREEAAASGEKEQKKPNIADRILHPKIMRAVQENPRVQEMSQSMRAKFREALEELFDRAQKVMSAQSIMDVQQLIGKQIPGVEKLSELPPEQQRAANDQIMKTIRSAVKNMYSKNLAMQIKTARQAGVPDGHPMLSDLAAAAKRIKSL